MSFTIEDAVRASEAFRYQLLGRLRMDCNAYIENGDPKRLWAHSPQKQIEFMNAIYDSFDDDKKPEWLSKDEIENINQKIMEKERNNAQELETVQMDNGEVIPLYNLSNLRDFFKEKFPEGITISVPPMSINELKEMDDYKITGDFHNLDLTEFWGKINNTQGYLEYAGEGILQAEMRLKPEDYHLIMPEDTYANRDDNVACEDLDWDVKAATTFAHIHGQNTDDMTVEVTKGVESLRHLYIEGRPFHQAVKDIYHTGCTLDIELKQLYALEDLMKEGLKGKPVPECLEELMEEVTKNAPLEKKEELYQLRAHELLMKCGYVAIQPFNIKAQFKNEQAAYDAVDKINQMNPEEVSDYLKPIAVRNGSLIEVSNNNASIKGILEMEKFFIMDDDCLEVDVLPYQDFRQTSYLMLANGQVIGGYRNMENLHRGTELYLHDNMLSQYKTDNAIPFNAMKEIQWNNNSEIQVVKEFQKQQMLDSAYLIDVKFIHTAENEMIVSARTIRQGNLESKVLKPEDVALYHAAKDMGEYNFYDFERLTAYDYYKNEITEEAAHFNRMNEAKNKAHERIEKTKDRIEHVELFGKIDNLKMRCIIDGKWTEGRSVPQKSLIMHSFSFLNNKGKEWAHYNNYFHESVLKSEAYNLYKDVLGVEETKQQSFKR